jgi:hypothetical protein
MTVALNLLSILLALGVPALIAVWAPRRWRVAALILWVVSPVILLLALGGVETMRNPAEADFGKLLYGIALIGSLLGLPWLLACLIGFGLGSLLRRKRPAPAAGSPASSAAIPGPAAASPVAARPAVRPAPGRAYGAALLILLGALVVIAGATLVTLNLSPDPPPPKLDRIPEMPRPR